MDRQAIQDIIDDMSETVRVNDTSGSWAPIFDSIEEWRDDLDRALNS